MHRHTTVQLLDMSNWQNSRASQWAQLCVCAAIMRSFSFTLLPRWPLGMGQHARCPFQHTQWAYIHKPGQDREKEANNILSDIRLPIAPSLHHFPSSVCVKQAIQTVPTSSAMRPTVCCPGSQTSPLTRHTPALRWVWTRAKTHVELVEPYATCVPAL